MVEPIVESSTDTILNVAKAEAIRVLHVDDDQVFLKVAKQCLKTQGEFEVDTASSINEALEKLKKTDYDVIVSDYQMPGKDGLEFLKELRKKGNTVPLVIFTGKGREEIAMKALNLGASGYFTKHGQPETVYGELAYGIRQAAERKKTETTMWEREERLKAVFSSSPDAIAVSDLHGNILDCNEAAWKMLGFSSMEELVGKSSFDFVAQRDRQKAYETLKKTLEQGTTRNLEYTLLNKDGEESWGELSASIMKDSSGNTSGLVSIMRDITERKKMEEEKSRLIHDLHERLRELNCSYGMSRLFEKSDISLDNAMQKTADLLPLAMQYPDITCARIVVENREFSTKNFKETRWKLQADIEISGKKVGSVEVRYLEERPTIVEGPFLKEERLLVDAVAERLGKITKRKKTEQALKESEERSRSIVENSSDQIFMLDRDCRFLSVNKNGADLFKMSPQEMVGRSMSEVFPETIAVQFSKNIKNIFDTGKSMHIDEKMVVEGRELYSSTSLNPVRDDSGRMIAVTGIVRDITESKKTEKMLQESEERFRAVFEGANDGILAADAKTRRFSFANPRICEITGYSLEELLKLGVGDINPKKDLPYVIDSFEKQRHGKVALSKDIPVLRKDERVVYCDVSSKSIKIGSQEYLVGFFRDVTEHRKAEEERREVMEKLQMMNEKLRVVGGLTRHDVNNKLAAITGNAYLARKKLPENNEVLDYMKQIEASVKQTVQIFDFARAYEMLGVEELVHVDVEKSVNEAISLFSDLKGIKVINDCHELTVLADSLLRQLFYNLIDNSLKYGEKLSWTRVYYEDKNDHLNLTYEDDGVGIPQAAKPKLFGEGYTTGKGSGYGLFLVKRMMEVYGWTIQETGTQGTGAQFTISIPRTNKEGKENYRLARAKQARPERELYRNRQI